MSCFIQFERHQACVRLCEVPRELKLRLEPEEMNVGGDRRVAMFVADHLDPGLGKCFGGSPEGLPVEPIAVERAVIGEQGPRAGWDVGRDRGRGPREHVLVDAVRYIGDGAAAAALLEVANEQPGRAAQRVRRRDEFVLDLRAVPPTAKRFI